MSNEILFTDLSTEQQEVVAGGFLSFRQNASQFESLFVGKLTTTAGGASTTLENFSISKNQSANAFAPES